MAAALEKQNDLEIKGMIAAYHEIEKTIDAVRSRMGLQYNKTIDQQRMDPNYWKIKGLYVAIKPLLARLVDEQMMRRVKRMHGEDFIFDRLLNLGVSNDISNYVGGDRGPSSIAAWKSVPEQVKEELDWYLGPKPKPVAGPPPGGVWSPMMGGSEACVCARCQQFLHSP